MTIPSYFATTIERGVSMLGLFRPLMGERSTGTIGIAASSADVVVTKNTILFPLREGTEASGLELDVTAPFRTKETKTITSAGTTIEIASILGGVAQNLPEDTAFVFYPPRLGIERSSLVAPAALTGATSLDADNAIKTAVFYEQADKDENIPDELLRSVLGATPGLVLSWAGSPEIKAKGNLRGTREDRWLLTIVTGRNEGAFFRSFTGLTLLDLCEAIILDRGSVDTGKISEPGIVIRARSRRAALPNLSAHALMFSTFTSIEGLAVSDPTKANPDLVVSQWLTTTLSCPTLASETGTHPGKLDIVPPGTYPQGTP